MESVNLKQYGQIFCDSLEAYNWLLENKLPKNCKIFSSAPALLCLENRQIYNIEKHWTKSKLFEFQSNINSFIEHIYAFLIKKESIKKGRVLSTCLALLIFHRIIYKAACIQNIRFSKKTLIIRITDDDIPGKMLNTPWEKILRNITKIDILKFDANYQSNNHTKPPLLRKFYVAGLETFIYRISINLLKIIPDFFFKRRALIFNENELLIETSYELLKKGFKLKKFNKNNNPEFTIKQKIKIDNIDFIKNELKKKLLKLGFSDILIINCLNMASRLIETCIHEYDIKLINFSNKLKTASKKDVILINSPGNISGFSLMDAARKKKLPVISFQHGVSPEISSMHHEVAITYEVNASDLFIAYNEESANVSRKNSYATGDVFVAGMSKRHIRMNQKINKESQNSIVYVSTNLYRGNVSNLTTSETDFRRCSKEIELIDKVLSKINTKVAYKSYPVETPRYIDTDPVHDFIGQFPNITLIDKKLDMRYLIKDFNVFITSMATSTVGWLILANKPLIFINKKGFNPLFDECIDIFEEGLFVFHDDEDYFDKLINLLNLPYEDLILKWQQKAKARNILIEQFFTKRKDTNSGKFAANYIFQKFHY